MAEELPCNFVNVRQGCDHWLQMITLTQCSLCDTWLCERCTDEHMEDEHYAK